MKAQEKHKLNVIFHGLFAFVIWDHCIEVLAPDVADHEYKAGVWKFERRLREGATYHLKGVKKCGQIPSQTPDTGCNAVLDHFVQVDRQKRKLFCSFVLPFPEDIIHMRPVSCKEDIFGGTDAGGLPRTITAAQGFVYSYSDLYKLRLEEDSPCNTLPWKAELNENLGSDDGYVNLHLWAEEDFKPNDDGLAHAQMAFKELVGLFPGLDLRVVHNEPIPLGSGHPPMQGLPLEQLLGLWERAQCKDQARLEEHQKYTDIYNCVPLYVTNSSM